MIAQNHDSYWLEKLMEAKNNIKLFALFAAAYFVPYDSKQF